MLTRTMIKKLTVKPSGISPLKRGGGWRISLLTLVVLLAFAGVLYRLFGLSFIEHDDYSKIAELQRENPTALSKRGSIYYFDSSKTEKNIAATNKTVNVLYSNNKYFTDTAYEVGRQLAEITGANPDELKANFLEAGKSYQILADDLTDVQVEAVGKLKIKGLSIIPQIIRTYPSGSLAGQVLGFVGFSGKERVGQYGVEAYYNETLNSKKDVVLTIDKYIQEMVETKLEEILRKWSSPSGSIIVQDPRNGNILAMVSSPSFDPNFYPEYPLEYFINPAVQEVYEPGSSFKPITMAGAINKEAVTPETTYFDAGRVTVADRVIKNFDEKVRGTKTMREVLQLSLNTGAVFAEEKMGDDAFLNNAVAFGFGQKTGIDVSGEVTGNISNLYNNRKINFATASFGQGIAVTAIQLVNAYSAIANGGKLLKPNVVKEIIDEEGSSIKSKPVILGSPIDEKTAKIMQSMLVDVVDKGFDKARVQGYDVAGKTGTAQIPDPKGGYIGDFQFIHNFVGFVPAYDARFTILIKMDRPKGIKFASDSLSPVFGEIVRYLIRYFNIPPTR